MNAVWAPALCASSAARCPHDYDAAQSMAMVKLT